MAHNISLFQVTKGLYLFSHFLYALYFFLSFLMFLNNLVYAAETCPRCFQAADILLQGWRERYNKWHETANLSLNSEKLLQNVHFFLVFDQEQKVSEPIIVTVIMKLWSVRLRVSQRRDVTAYPS